MSKARLVITAVVLEGRSVSEVARTYGVARSWVYALVARYRAEGDAAFEPRSRRPFTRPDATAAPTVVNRPGFCISSSEVLRGLQDARKEGVHA